MSNVILVGLAELFIVSLFGNVFLFHASRKLMRQLNSASALLKQERQRVLGWHVSEPILAERKSVESLTANYLAYLKKLRDAAINKLEELDNDTLQKHTSELDASKALAQIRFEILQADWDAIHNPNTATDVWETLFEKIAPKLQSLATQPDNSAELSAELLNDYEKLKENTEFYQQRIEHLEDFRRMFFELEESLQSLRSENDSLGEQILNYATNEFEREKFQVVLDQYKLNQEKLIGKLKQQQTLINTANKDVRSHLPTNQREREDLLFDANPQYALAKQDLQLLEKINAEQRSSISKLLGYNKTIKENESMEQLIGSQEHELRKLEENMKNTKHCIYTLEVSLSDATHKIQDLETENKKLRQQTKEISYLETTIMQFSRDSAQMMDCIETLEKNIEELRREKEEKDEKIVALGKSNAKKDQEFSKLKAEFIGLEERYIKMSRLHQQRI